MSDSNPSTLLERTSLIVRNNRGRARSHRGCDTRAYLVLGQPDFAHRFQNFVDSKDLWSPSSVAIDSSGHVNVADTQNERVLGCTSPSSAVTAEVGLA